MSSWTEPKLATLLADTFDGAWGEPAKGGDGVAVLRSTNMRGGRLSFNEAAKRIFTSKVLKKKRLIGGDILVNKSSGSAHLVGASVIFYKPEDTQEYMCSNFIRCLRPNFNLVDPEYLYFALQSPQFRSQVFGAQRTTSGLRNLKIKEYLDAKVVLAPLKDEQRRIVACIKECMERVEEIEGLRAETLQERDYLLESLIEAEYQQAEGKEVTLADVCSITSRLVDPREQQYVDLLHVGGGNIEAKTSKLLELKTAREEKLKSSKFVFDESMVLYNKIRPYLMKVARPDFSGLCSADMYPLFPDPEKLTKDYLFYLLLSRNFTDYAIAGSNRAGMPKVNRNHLFAYKFTLPNIDEQQRITEILDIAVSAIEELRTDMTKSTEETNALREAVLRKAFAGEL